jgi:transposase-like protein
MKKRKTYSKEFKEEAICLVKEESLTWIQVERDPEILYGSVSKWIGDKKKFQRGWFHHCEPVGKWMISALHVGHYAA